MNPVRQIAFGYSTKCNIRCGHCVAADASPGTAKMDFDRAKDIIQEMGEIPGHPIDWGQTMIIVKNSFKNGAVIL